MKKFNEWLSENFWDEKAPVQGNIGPKIPTVKRWRHPAEYQDAMRVLATNEAGIDRGALRMGKLAGVEWNGGHYMMGYDNLGWYLIKGGLGPGDYHDFIAPK